MNGSRLTTVWGRLLLVLSLFLVALPGFSRTDLYEASVPVADRSAQARDQALRQALGEVLGRLAGGRVQAGSDPESALLANPGRFVRHYRYEGGETAGGLQFRVGFDGPALEAAARAQGLTLWGRERPPLLVWLAVDDGSRRYLLGSDSAEAVYADLQAAARRRGLVLVLPLLDLEDQSQVSYSDVWGGFLERVVPASARYQAQAVLVGRLQRLGSAAWTSRWTLRMAGRDETWQAGGADVAATLDEGLARATEQLTAQLAVPAVTGVTEGLPISIEGVTGLADYVQVEQYLAGLAAVRSVRLVGVRGSRLDYRVEVQGGAGGLDQAIGIGRLLERVPSPAAPAALPGTPAGGIPGVPGTARATYRLRH